MKHYVKVRAKRLVNWYTLMIQ